jgi:hypothetical protein
MKMPLDPKLESTEPLALLPAGSAQERGQQSLLTLLPMFLIALCRRGPLAEFQQRIERAALFEEFLAVVVVGGGFELGHLVIGEVGVPLDPERLGVAGSVD